MSRDRVILNWRVMIGVIGVAEVHDGEGVLGVHRVQQFYTTISDPNVRCTIPKSK